MRKLKVLLTLLLISLLVFGGVLIYQYSTSKRIKEEFYVVKENKSYVIENNRKMTFSIYSNTKNSLIIYRDNNVYTLKLNNISLVLEDVEVVEYQIPGSNLVKISSPVPNITETEYICEAAVLSITNPEYTLDLELGTLSFLNSNYYKLLSFKTLYGSYSYVDGVLELVGINLTLTESYEYLQSLRIGGYTYGTLSKSKADSLCEHEIEIQKIINNYSIERVEENYLLSLKTKTYFIPLGYKYIYMIRSGYIVMELDGNKYYIDLFDYMMNDLDYYDYKDKMIKGGLVYA